jgi:beta-phosphoglucomutase-like phosphatase (HAD superfamily)
VVIEDAALGIESARAAHMKAIALTGTYSAAQLAGADLIISSLTQLQVGWNQNSINITLEKSDSKPHSNARPSSS